MWPKRQCPVKLAGLFLASLAAWYLGYLLADLIPKDTITFSIANLQDIGNKPVLRAPVPKRQKCDHWSPCSPGSYAYRILSGGGKAKLAKICFEDDLLISEEKGNVGRGINIAIVNCKSVHYLEPICRHISYKSSNKIKDKTGINQEPLDLLTGNELTPSKWKRPHVAGIWVLDDRTGKVTSAQFFDMWEGDHSGEMMTFIKNAPEGSLLLMVTQDEGSSRLKNDAKKLIEELGSKQIWNMKFRSSWAFIAAKGFKLPDDIQKEKINHSDKNNRYNGWPAEIQIEGCIPRNLI